VKAIAMALKVSPDTAELRAKILALGVRPARAGEPWPHEVRIVGHRTICTKLHAKLKAE